MTACHIDSRWLPLRLTADPSNVTCRRCLALIRERLKLRRDGDSLTLPEPTPP